jgi:hypothetical protein
MIKIAHESPKSIFEDVQRLTDYDYALVHLFEEDEEYLNLFKTALNNGREVILDNSIFELGTAFDAERYAYWIKELKPTYYIIPDALESINGTITQCRDWLNFYDNVPGKKIGVVQGQTYEDLVACYRYMDKSANVDTIAISFDYSYYSASVPNPNTLVSWALGRVKLLGDLKNDGIINTRKQHHLLGCSLPQEFSFYTGDEWHWITSLDTSNPVVHGIKQIKYGTSGLMYKESQKLFEMINLDRDKIDLVSVKYNINSFKKITNGESNTVDSLL